MASGNSETAIGTHDSVTASDEAEALSPTDGYFNAVAPQPEDEYVPDPNQVNSAAAKEIEAREAQEERERRRNSRRIESLEPPQARPRDLSPAASSILSASSTGSVDTTSAREEIVERAPRPTLPSYDDAIAERPYRGQPFESREQPSYGTMEGSNVQDAFPSSQRVASGNSTGDMESQPLLRPSLSGGGDETWRERWARKWRAWKKPQGPNNFAKKLLLLLIIGFCIVFAGRVIADYKRHWGDDHGHAEPSIPRMPSEPDEPTKPTYPDEPLIPEDPEDVRHGRFRKGAVDFCHSDSILDVDSYTGWKFGDPVQIGLTQTSNAAFALHSLLQTSGNFDQDPVEFRDVDFGSSKRRRDVRHQGQVIIERKEKGRGVSLQVGGYYSHRALARQAGFAADGSSILFQVPRTFMIDDTMSDDLCVYSYAVIQVAPGYNLSRLAIDTEVMSLSVQDSLELGIEAESMSLQSHVGTIEFPDIHANVSGIRSRNIHVKTSVGKITGKYPLYDSLSLVSKAGRIDVAVDPREADPDNVKPAFLSIEAETSEVKVETANLDRMSGLDAQNKHLDWPPARDYKTEIYTIAGVIDARLLLGTSIKVRSQAGDTRAFLVPCGNPEQASNIEVEARAGLVSVEVAKSIRSPKARLRYLSMQVENTVGTQTIGLPSTWQGRLEGRVLGGRFRIALTDFVASRTGFDPNIPLFYSIEGHRGHGHGLITSASKSGSIVWTDTPGQ